MRLVSTLLLVAAVSLVAALPATAKEGVKATLATKIPLDAAPGTELHIAWTLAYVENGQRHAFGAGGVFVRLLSASGAKPETAVSSRDSGEFSASVIVPEGGIGDVQIGLHGFSTNPRAPSDMLFPITNDPLPGKRVTTPLSGGAGGGSTTAWIVATVAASLFGMCILAALAVARRRHPLEAN